MSEASSYRQILRSSSIIGGASVINIVVGLLRTKVAAMLLGPAGVGMIGLLQSLMVTASTIASLGIGTVGTRQIAEAAGHDGTDAVMTARRALFWGSLALALTGATVFWTLRGVLAEQVLGDSNLASTVGWMALGVALAVASGSQGALLNGLRRIGDIARVSVMSGLLTTTLGIGSLMLWGENGVLAFVLATPLASFLLGHFFVSQLPKVSGPATPLSHLIGEWCTLARLGTAFMVAGLVTTVGQLTVRTLVQRELGVEALGHFQAASTISMTYIGFVLHAMGTDYYPRLTAVIHDRTVANRMVNEQTAVALLLAGPALLVMMGLAPWIIQLLYTSGFAEAASVLRWQVMGDALKIASWPLGFIILASGDGRTFMLTESLAIIVFVGITWIGLPILGIKATGIAVLGMYVVSLPVVYWLARRRTGFGWDPRVKRDLATLLLAAVTVCIASEQNVWLGTALSVMVAMLFGMHNFNRLQQMANISSFIGHVSALFRRAILFQRKS